MLAAISGGAVGNSLWAKDKLIRFGVGNVGTLKILYQISIDNNY